MNKRKNDTRLLIAGMVFLFGFFIIPKLSFADFSQLDYSKVANHGSGGSMEVVLANAPLTVPSFDMWVSDAEFIAINSNISTALATVNADNTSGSWFQLNDIGTICGGTFIAGALDASSNGRNCGTNTQYNPYVSVVTSTATTTVGGTDYVKLHFSFSATSTPTRVGTYWGIRIGNNASALGSYTFDPNSNLFCYPNTGCGDTSVNALYYDFPSGVAPPSISFVYPTNGTTTLPFNNFITSFSNLTSTDNYQVSINYFIPNTSNNNTVTITKTGGQLMAYAGTLSNQNFGITASEVANATLYDITNFEIPDNLDNYIVATTSITWSANYSTTSSQQTYAFVNASGTVFVSNNVQSITNINESSTMNCESPSSTLDLGGDISWGLCSAGQALFVGNPALITNLQNSISNFQNVFPFSLFFGITNPVENVINNTASSTPQALNLEIMGLNYQYYNLGSITSSTLVNVLTTNHCDTTCANDAVGNYFGVSTMLIWLTAGIKIVLMVTKGV